MCQVLFGKVSLFDCSVDLRAERVESALEGRGDGAECGERGGQPRAQQTVVGPREEQGDPEAEVSSAIAEAVGDTLDETVQAQPAQLVGDGALGDQYLIAP